MNIKEDNRRNQRIDPNHCGIGDLYRPWFFFDDPDTGSTSGTNHVCLIYNKYNAELDTADIHATSFLTDVRGESRDEYNRDTLRESIKENGQLVPIVVTDHYTVNTNKPIDPLLNDPELNDLHCFEGHHRLVCCEELERKVKAEVYCLYHMDLPIDYSKHYNSNYSSSFWSDAQTEDSKGVWFSEAAFDSLANDHKKEHLDLCLRFVRSLNLNLEHGIDIGCAEGAYSFWAAGKLANKMTGVDLELGRIVRGLIMRAKHKRIDVDFFSSPWGEVDYSPYDFAMGLSILHHMEDPAIFLHKVAKNKKAMILEVRMKDQYQAINRGTVLGINTREYYEAIFKELGMKAKLISGPLSPDRFFYVLWK